MNPDENDILARRGQNQFKLWCEDDSLLCQSPSADRLGWDFLVEFPEPSDDKAPLDRQNELKKVLVQIKATTKREKSARGKILAFKNLVDSNLPAFVVHIEFGKKKVRRARLLHIGETEIAEILKATRKAELKKYLSEEEKIPREEEKCLCLFQTLPR